MYEYGSDSSTTRTIVYTILIVKPVMWNLWNISRSYRSHKKTKQPQVNDTRGNNKMLLFASIIPHTTLSKRIHRCRFRRRSSRLLLAATQVGHTGLQESGNSKSSN